MLELNYVICSSMILHRSIIDITGGFSECEILTAIEDYHLWLKVSTITDIQYIDKTLVWYKDEPHTSIRKDGETNDKLIKRNVIRELKNWRNYSQLSSHLKNIISKAETENEYKILHPPKKTLSRRITKKIKKLKNFFGLKP